MGAAAGVGVEAIRCGTFLYRGWNRTREIQKPLVFGGVLFHISFAVERNMAAGGIHAGRGCSPQSENEQRAVGDAGPYGVYDRSHGGTTAGRRGRRPLRRDRREYAGTRRCADAGRRGRQPLRGASIWVRRKMRTGCGAKKARSAVDRTRCAIGVGGGESRRCHSAGTK